MFPIVLWDITLTLTRPLHFTSKIGVNLGLAVGIALWFSHTNNLWKLLLNLAIVLPYQPYLLMYLLPYPYGTSA